MSHSSPGKGEVQDLKKLPNLTLEFFTLFLATMCRFEELNKAFGGLLSDKSYKKDNPYESMLLDNFFVSQAKAKSQYNANLLKYFWPKGGDNRKYQAINQFLINYQLFYDKYHKEAQLKFPDKKLNAHDIAMVFAVKEIGIMSANSNENRAETQRAMEFINSLLSDDTFYKSFADAVYACAALPNNTALSGDIKKALNIRSTDAQAESPLASPFQTIMRIPLLMDAIIKNEVNPGGMDFQELEKHSKECGLFY